MDIVKEIRDYVENECKKPTSHYGYEPFPFHLIPMVKHAEKLAETFNVDKELILLAAWLHDIGSIIHGRKDHHITGATIAGEKLREYKYPQEKIEIIKKCIFNHRASQRNNCETIEEKIISEADALSNFDNIPGIFKAAFIFENLNQGEAKVSARKKLEGKWNNLHFEESKNLVKGKFEAAMLLLK